ncbi:Asp23/Gls24 family envelope stress response protein [Phytohabitans sp. ZYX-F-186]|uniref:Asp23/Gls24 family envelope stress response protein n=1 Tax=Phytohabitans maris TaxID=3071409 RepID=A0ABU0ZS51_9ACTN|nr:Asp23/Gls24 family envelope stress response protein [Phytohabitans sp. ZYX-F-186]MDQ7909851.1 Asp23/Gls24 family envelope stress response protein [Phytohabitans sp. ZYX-F-186]
MTDVAAQVPTQRQESTGDETIVETPAAASPAAAEVTPAAEPAAEPEPAPAAANGTAAQISEQVSDAVERAGDAVERAAAASGRVASQVVDRLRNNAELAAERGMTSIADEVVEKIAGIATREVPGVYDLGGDVARFFANVKERIGLGDADEDADRGMSVRLEGRTAVINITLVIEYGFVVHSVTEKVRAKVISSVENLLGLEVTEVNIRVDDVHIDDAGPVGGDEARAVGYQP